MRRELLHYVWMLCHGPGKPSVPREPDLLFTRPLKSVPPAALARRDKAQTETSVTVYHQCLRCANWKTEYREQVTDHKPLE